ncbi:hypothetical protein SAMN02745885_02734, partial [Carboxydocella sporoproducens DSM 16521]
MFVSKQTLTHDCMAIQQLLDSMRENEKFVDLQNSLIKVKTNELKKLAFEVVEVINKLNSDYKVCKTEYENLKVNFDSYKNRICLLLNDCFDINNNDSLVNFLEKIAEQGNALLDESNKLKNNLDLDINNNRYLDDLKTIILNINNVINNIFIETKNINNNTTQLASGAEEITSTINEMSASIKNVSGDTESLAE